MPARFTLHGHHLSGPTYKVALCLALAGEPMDYVHVDLVKGEHKQPAFVAKQRYGQVPLLVDRSNGRHLCQSAAILEYLADTLGRFGGATLEERLQIREWLFWEADRLASIYARRGIRHGYVPGGPDADAFFDMLGSGALKLLDGHLAGRDWIVGEGVTIADISAFGVVAFAGDAGFELSPHVAAWAERMRALPGFGTPEELLARRTQDAA